MSISEITTQDIPHGHGLSFKRGLADGLLNAKTHEDACPKTHRATYRKGLEEGKALVEQVALRVRPHRLEGESVD